MTLCSIDIFPKRKLKSVLVLSILATAWHGVTAQDMSLNPGKYATQEGELTIRQTSDGKLVFELISASSWNGHTCELDGAIHNSQATLGDLAGDAPEKKCVVQFHPGGDEIDVTSIGQICHTGYCGAAGHFEGVYVAVQRRCETAALTATRTAFQQAYGAKEYSKAVSLLQPVLEHCAPVLGESDVDSLRNDLAITQYHLHDVAACQRTLEPLREDAAKTDDELRETYPEFSVEEHLKIARSTRTNLKLCDELSRPVASPIPMGQGWFRTLVPLITTNTRVPVLLPAALPPEKRPLYASATIDSKSWRVEIGVLPNCSANACSSGFFEGEQDGPSLDSHDKRVRLEQGITGYYRDRSCGGSCAPPMIAWKDRNFTYTIQYVIDDAWAENQLIGLANSAILAGPR
jgi:hypothetical protein